MPSQVLVQARMDFQKACNNFFRSLKIKSRRRVGNPKFKNKSNEQSCRFPNHGHCRVEENKIWFSKLGKIRYRGQIKDSHLLSITITKLASGIYEASILIKTEIEPLPKTSQAVGLDLGLKDLIITSEGVKINNPKWFRKNQARLKKYQRRLARKKKNSKNRNKARIKVAKIYRQIANARKDFIHKATTEIVKNYDIICIEDLNAKGMLKNRRLAKSISDVSFRMIRSFLEYKSAWYDKTLVVIDRWFPSSKTCGECGSIYQALKQGQEEWICSDCGTKHDRDINAAINILREGLRIIGSEGSKFTPVEIV